MSAFVNIFTSGRHPRLIGVALWLAVSLALLAAATWFTRAHLSKAVTTSAQADLAHFDKLHANVMFAFDELARTVTASPCSPLFMQQLRRVAFLPDGLNEFIYAPGGMVTCSTSIGLAENSRSLGPPDIVGETLDDVSIWLDEQLDSVGLVGVAGHVVAKGPFAVVVPAGALGVELSSQMRKELVLSASDGRNWHLGGENGLFDSVAPQARLDAVRASFTEVHCGEQHRFCIAVTANASDLVLHWYRELLIAVGLIGFYAIWPASALQRRLDDYWSFEQRFKRNLNGDTVVCVYQPILDVGTGKISGCEVLARWRDVDGTIITPDGFIDVVERSGQTLAFTKMVADRAFAELSSQLPVSEMLQINFNIFPRDLDSEKLAAVFQPFEAERKRFSVALEIVESDALGIEHAQREIEELARRGFRTYIDDFGSGYSSIHRVASLAIHGVKLDRSFAMAPSESLMARMFTHALDMVASSGREIVVEGVETEERLGELAATGRAAYAQGYLISKPLAIDGLVAFLAAHDASALKRDALAAA